jgi:hypothetical protein
MVRHAMHAIAGCSDLTADLQVRHVAIEIDPIQALDV